MSGIRAPATWSLALALALAALWPLTAHFISPLAMPMALAVLAVAATTFARPAYGIAVALVGAPLVNAVVAPGFAAVPLPGKPLQLLVPALAFGVLAYAALTRRNRAVEAGPTPLSRAIVGFAAVSFLVSVQAIDPTESINKLGLIASATALFFAVREACRDQSDLDIVLGGALMGLLVASIQGLIQNASGIYSEQGFVSGGEVVGRIQGSFGHPNLYAGYLALLIPVAGAIAISNGFGPRLRWLAGVSFAFAIPALYFTYARGAMVGLVLGVILWLALTRPRWAVACVLILAVAGATLMPATLRERFDPQDSEGDVTLRSDIWSAALEIYGEHPILGTGVNNFGVAYRELPSTGANAAQRRLLHQDQVLVPPHPQSVYLQALAEGGIVGMGALAVLIVTALLTVVRTARGPNPRARVVGASLGIGFAGMLLHGFLEVPFMSETMLALFALLGVCTVYLDLQRRRDSIPERA